MSGTPTEQTGDRAPAARRGNKMGFLLCVLALGLLIWAKLQLVAGVPRTAIAVPERPTPGAQTVDATPLGELGGDAGR